MPATKTKRRASALDSKIETPIFYRELTIDLTNIIKEDIAAIQKLTMIKVNGLMSRMT